MRVANLHRLDNGDQLMRLTLIAFLLVLGESRVFGTVINEDQTTSREGEVDRPISETVPGIISVFPPDGAKDVAVVTEIKVRFDQPMKPGSFSLEWNGRGEDGAFHRRGNISYDAELFEFTLPVVLKSGVIHEILVNDGPMTQSSIRRNSKFVSGFQSARGAPAKPFNWSFTSGDSPETVCGPNIVSIIPKPDTEIALATELRVRFDVPMDPLHYDLHHERVPFGTRIQLFGNVSYDPLRTEFRIPIAYPANWNGVFQLRGFRGLNGHTAEARRIGFRTLREPLSTKRRESIAKASESEILRILLENVRNSHLGIKSAKIAATSRMMHSNLTWAYTLSSTVATFAKEDDKFFGDVSEIMAGSAFFQVGSNGDNCWFRFNDTVTVGPSAEIARQNVSIADGFGLLSGANAISTFDLEYAGKEQIEGRTLHRLRGWANVESRSFGRTYRVGSLREWLVDADTSLVFRARYGTSSETEFSYQLVNEDIPDEIFAVPIGPNVVTKELEALGTGYSQRFLKVSDGTNGRMSLRWGKVGKRGTSSSGLN